MQLFDVHAPMVTKNNKKQKPPWLTFNLKQMDFKIKFSFLIQLLNIN